MIRWLVRALVLLLVAAVVAVGALVGTERGAQRVAALVEAAGGGLLAFEDVRGTLAGGLTVGRLTVVTEASRTVLSPVAATLNPAALAAGQVRFAVAEVGRVRVELLRPADPERPFEMPRVATPVPLRFVTLSVGALEVWRRDDRLFAADGIRADASWYGTRLDVHDAHANIAGLAVGARGVVRLDAGLPLDANVDWRWPAQSVAGAGRVHGDMALLRFAQALRVPEPVEVEGTLARPADAPRLDARARWDRIVRPVEGLGDLAITAGTATAGGWIDDWRATALARLAAPGWLPMRAEAAARGDREAAAFDSILLEGPAGRVSGGGRWSFAGTPRFALDLAAAGVDPGVLRAGLRGRVSADLSLEADPDGHVAIDVRRLDGTLMERALSGTGRLDWRDGTLAFDDVALDAGPNRLRADGSWGERLAGRVSLVAPAPGILWPGLKGALTLDARLAGTGTAPVIDLEARGTGFGIDDVVTRALRLSASVDRRQRAIATLSAAGFTAGGVALGDVEGRVDGTLARHALELRAQGGDIEATLAATGNWNGERLGLALSVATVAEASLGTWRLDGEPQASVAASRVAIGEHCWRQDPASLCVAEAAWTPGVIDARARLERFGLAGLAAWLPAGLSLGGEAGVDADLRWADGAPAGTFALALSGAELRYDDGEETLVVPLREAGGTLSIDGAGARGRFALAGDAGLAFSLEGTMAPPVGRSGVVDLRVTGALPDVAPFLPFLAADVGFTEAVGSLALDAGVGGTLDEPQLTGVARLSRGAFVLPAWGLKVEAVDVALLGDGTRQLRVSGSARAGGLLRLSGEADPLAPGGPTATIRASGNRLRAVDLPDLRVLASPDVTVRYEAGRFKASGRVQIPKADIIVRQLPRTATPTSPDAVVHGRAAAAPSAPAPVAGELLVELGRDVRLEGYGLTTGIEGQVRLAAASADELRGFGTLRLRDGKFGAYGRELVIERGTLGFNGPLDNPSLNVRASRRIDWEGRLVKAGLEIRGTAERPESRVFSEPAMAEADALSYLIAGRPLQTASAADRSTITGAALALGAQQAAPLTQRIGSAVALDELSVAGGSLDDAAVVAGKQFGSNLYLRFQYGLFRRIGTVMARYRLSRTLSVEATSGEDQALDLVWSTERD